MRAESGGKVFISDLLVVYTAAARSAAGGASAIQSQIEAAVLEANVTLVNSRVSARVRLVGTAEVAYQESGSLWNDLSRLRNPNDGLMDEVHVFRDEVGADLVCLVTEKGFDYELYGLQGPSAASAFSIIRRHSLTGSYALPVTLSFNFGCQLERPYADSVAAFPYSYGHSFRAP